MKFQSSDGNSEFYVESADEIQSDVDDYGLEKAGISYEKFTKGIMNGIKPFAETILSHVENLNIKPDNTSLEFGISFTAGGDIFFVKASGEASVKVTLNWANQKNKFSPNNSK